MYRFLENFETGIPFIDNGHRRLLEDMEEAREALAANRDDEFHRLSAQLLTTMQEHIMKQHVYEEEIMLMSRDSELEEQKEGHQHFRSIIYRHKTSMNFQSDQEELVALMNFLNEWFLQHVLASDVLIGSAVKKAKAAAVKAKAQAAKEARRAEKASEAAKVDSPVTTETTPTVKIAAPKTTKQRATVKKQSDATLVPDSPAASGNADAPPASKTAKRKASVKAPPAHTKSAASVAPASADQQVATVVKTNNKPVDPFAFTDEFRTQIPLIDKEHETLFSLVRQTYDLVHDRFCVDKFDSIVAILGELRDYTIKHFADEERYMKSINYEGLDEQIKAHTAFVDQLNGIDLSEIDQNQEATLDDLIRFLLNWLVQHILKVDKKIPYNKEAALNLTT